MKENFYIVTMERVIEAGSGEILQNQWSDIFVHVPAFYEDEFLYREGIVAYIMDKKLKFRWSHFIRGVGE